MLSIRSRYTSVVLALAALLVTGGAASAQGPDDRPPPIDAPGPLVGSIEITNERDRPLQIYVDGRFAIELRARTTDTLERVPNGIRLVSYNGAGGRDAARWQTDRVEVREGRRASLRIAPLRGQVAIANRAEIDLQLMLGDIDLGVVKSGRELVSPPLPEGSYRLSAVPLGWARSKPQVQDVTIIAGETVRAEIRSFAATLVVSNPFPRRVTVWIDGERYTRLDRLESERIGRLQPGRVLAELRDNGRVLASEMVDLFPGRETYFAPQPIRYGALEVRNPTREPVRVTLDNSGGFRLAPGAVRAFDNLAAGPIVIQVTTEDGRIVKHQAQIIGGETNRFEVPYGITGPENVPVRPRPR